MAEPLSVDHMPGQVECVEDIRSGLLLSKVGLGCMHRYLGAIQGFRAFYVHETAGTLQQELCTVAIQNYRGCLFVLKFD